jgi:hypothetical protein
MKREKFHIEFRLTNIYGGGASLMSHVSALLAVLFKVGHKYD